MKNKETFKFYIQDIIPNPGKGGIILIGKVESGEISIGDTVSLDGGRIKTTVLEIHKYRRIIDRAVAGDEVGIILEGLKKGDVTKDTMVEKTYSLLLSEDDLRLFARINFKDIHHPKAIQLYQNRRNDLAFQLNETRNHIKRDINRRVLREVTDTPSYLRLLREQNSRYDSTLRDVREKTRYIEKCLKGC